MYRKKVLKKIKRNSWKNWNRDHVHKVDEKQDLDLEMDLVIGKVKVLLTMTAGMLQMKT
jgi:hypothetical protein